MICWLPIGAPQWRCRVVLPKLDANYTFHADAAVELLSIDRACTLTGTRAFHEAPGAGSLQQLDISQSLWLLSMNVFDPLVFDLEGRTSGMRFPLRMFGWDTAPFASKFTPDATNEHGLHMAACCAKSWILTFVSCRTQFRRRLLTTISGLCILAGQPTACSSVNVFPQPVDFHRYQRRTAAETAVRTRVCTKQIDCVTRTVLRRAATAARASLRSRPRFVTVSQMENMLYGANFGDILGSRSSAPARF